MKTVQKVLVSLLVATVVFTGFAVAAYSGLFSVIDTRFYNQRIRANTQALLEESQEIVDDYTRTLQREIGTLAANPAVTNVFLINQSRQDIDDQNQLIGTLLENRPEIDYIRIVDNERGRLWFSTLEDDIRNRTDVSVEYRAVSELEPPLSLPPPESDGSRSAWLPGRGALRVTIPMVDSFSIPRGTLVAWVGTSGVFSLLVDAGIIGPSNRVRLTPEGTLIVNAPRHLDGADLEELDQALSDSERMPVIDSSIGSSFAIESMQSSNGLPQLAYLLHEDALEMDTPLQVILLASVFLLTFIVAYLVMNIRQDPTVVVAERFRRFQESVVKDYLREGRAIDPELWQRELESRKEQIEREMKRGLGRVSDETREHVEQSMRRSWEELSRLLGTGHGSQRAQLEPVSLKQIEDIIERTLARYGETVPHSSRSVTARSVGDSGQSHGPAETEELRERDEPQEREPGSADAELEELDELDELEDEQSAEELEPVEVEELSELDEAEQTDEVEELDELDELDEAEGDEAVHDVEEAEELGELDESQELELEPVEVEELSELDEAEQTDEVEELDELEDVPSAEQVESVDADYPPEVDGFANTGQLTALDEEKAETAVQSAGPEIPDDWFEFSKTALELAEDGVDEPLGSASASHREEPKTGRGHVDEPDVIEELEATEVLDDAEVADEPQELQEPEELEEVAELEPLDEDGDLDELEEPEDLEEVSEFEVDSDVDGVDSEEVEELEDESETDDESEPVEVEDVDHYRTPFFSAVSSFGSAAELTQWRLDSPAPDRPSVYRADEIRPEAVAIRGIENTNTHHVVDLDDFVAFAGKNQTVIEEREGLIRIEASAYFGEYHEVDQRTQALADQVMTRRSSQGIDDVLGASFGNFDFGDILGGDESDASDPADSPDSPLRVVSGGFELPYVTAGGESGVRQVYRQLVRLTRRWNARVALLLEETRDHGLRGGFGLGMPEECSEQILLGAESDLARTIVPYQRVALLKQPLSAFRDFAGTCQAQKLSAINNWLLLPLKDSDKRRYLMVGFARSFDDLMDLSVQYEIIPRAV
ncbi:MAG: hypothetical protein WD492_17610 [Alkalispirochaeta sp.]